MFRTPSFFFFNDTATTEIYTLSLHDALPILDEERNHCGGEQAGDERPRKERPVVVIGCLQDEQCAERTDDRADRSEEHTSELQSRQYLVCRLLLEKKKYETIPPPHRSVATTI